jgi:hypothetical protein
MPHYLSEVIEIYRLHSQIFKYIKTPCMRIEGEGVAIERKIQQICYFSKNLYNNGQKQKLKN